MKRFPFVMVVALFVGLLVVVTPAAGTEADAEWLAQIGELNGGIASYTRTSLDCRYLAQEAIYICPEPLPAVLPTPDPAARARALARLGDGGLLLVTDSTSRRVMAFDPQTGDLLDENFIPADPDHLELPYNALLSPGGNTILVSSYGDDVIQEYDFMGNWLGVFAPAGGADPTLLDTPRGMTYRDNGNLLVANVRNPEINAVTEFSPAGAWLGDFIPDDSGGLDSPQDIVRYGVLWLVSAAPLSSAIHRYDDSGAFVDIFAAVDNFPQQMQSAANGNLVVANFSGAQVGIIEYDPAGNVVNNFNPLAGNQRGIYELPNGNFLTTSGTTNGAVYEVDRTTGVIVDTKLSDNITPRFIEFIATSSYSISLEKTVGEDPAVCAVDSEISVPAGTEVTYCYTVTNTGTNILTSHDLVDDQLGVLLDDFSFSLAPGASTFVTATAVITESTVNTAVWTAAHGIETATAEASATVNVLPASIALEKTVGLLPGICATGSVITVTAGTEVTYCYTVTNTGEDTLTSHDLADSELGQLLDGFTFTLAPGASTFLTASATINVTTVNTATWTGYNAAGFSTSATASATVYVKDEVWLLYLPIVLND